MKIKTENLVEIVTNTINDVIVEGREREEINDFFNFLEKDPKKGGAASVYYASIVVMNKNLEGRGANAVPNPMYGKIVKYQRFNFNYGDTYRKAVDRNNEKAVAQGGEAWEIQSRKGDYNKVQGYDVIELNKNSELCLPIVPYGDGKGEFLGYYNTETGQPMEKEEVYKYMPPQREYKPSASGVSFRLLMVDKISELRADGKVWKNSNFIFKNIIK